MVSLLKPMTMPPLPKFTPEVPDLMLRGATPIEKYLMEQQSIQCQQNEWQMARAIESNNRFDKGDEEREDMKIQIREVAARIQPFERLQQQLSGKWSVIAFIGGVILIPAVLSFIGAWFIHLFDKLPAKP
jgi:hypothetical protein